jgi:hypothetical protein
MISYGCFQYENSVDKDIMNLKNYFKTHFISKFMANLPVLIFGSGLILSFLLVGTPKVQAAGENNATLESSLYGSKDVTPPSETKTKEQDEAFMFDMIQTEAKLKEEKDIIAKKFTNGLFVSPERTTMIVNSIKEFGVYGGDGPYKINVGNFGGKLTHIGGSSFVFQAPATEKDMMIKISDIKGRTSSVVVSVVVPLVVNPSAFTKLSPKSYENFDIKGGKPPYQVQQIDGKGNLENVVENHFSFRASEENSSVMIKVTDSLKNEFYVPIEVKSDETPSLVEFKSPFKEDIYSKKELETKSSENKTDDSNRKPAEDSSKNETLKIEDAKKEEPKKEEVKAEVPKKEVPKEDVKAESPPQEKSLGDLPKTEIDPKISDKTDDSNKSN